MFPRAAEMSLRGNRPERGFKSGCKGGLNSGGVAMSGGRNRLESRLRQTEATEGTGSHAQEGGGEGPSASLVCAHPYPTLPMFAPVGGTIASPGPGVALGNGGRDVRRSGLTSRKGHPNTNILLCANGNCVDLQSAHGNGAPFPQGIELNGIILVKCVAQGSCPK